MKNLWTPWRMSYILGQEKKGAGCIFEAGGGESARMENLILYRDRWTVVLLNRFPYAHGHLLIAPVRHIGDICDLDNDENAALMKMMRRSVAILRKHLQPDGFNVGLNIGAAAGAGLEEHLHFHVVPRWRGDHNFMTIMADVRTIPEHINRTFDLLLPDFQNIILNQ